MTQLILYTSEDEESVVKESLTTQTEGGPAASDQFRGVTKMIVHGKSGLREVNDEATQWAH